MSVVYMDMVADLLHYGHINAIKQAKNMGNILKIGIHSDKTVEEYKRRPILNMNERIKMLKSLNICDEIIPNAPLILDNDYIKKHKIDIITIPDNRTNNEINEWYSKIENVKLIKIKYTNQISTTEIIKRIQERVIQLPFLK